MAQWEYGLETVHQAVSFELLRAELGLRRCARCRVHQPQVHARSNALAGAQMHLVFTPRAHAQCSREAVPRYVGFPRSANGAPFRCALVGECTRFRHSWQARAAGLSRCRR